MVMGAPSGPSPEPFRVRHPTSRPQTPRRGRRSMMIVRPRLGACGWAAPRPPRCVPVSGSGLEAREGSAAGVACGVAELFLDAQQLVVLRDPFGPCRCAGLDLTGVRGHGEIGDRGVLGLSRTV